MEDKILKIETIHNFNEMKGVETLHPLISIINQSTAKSLSDHRILFGLYGIFLKESDCGNIIYGRQNYDYHEGSIVCISPGQVMSVIKHSGNHHPKGWALMFHPDLIRGTTLGKNIKNYSFFSYQANEALHLSEKEKQIIKECLHIIRIELEHPIDKHSKTLISSNIELLLNYCNRFYERQFMTRSDANKNILIRFENLLHDYFQSSRQLKSGVPTVKYCAGELCLSPNYFGDLIKKETGQSAQEYIQSYLIDMAKEQVLDTSKTITEIAYELGFQYPTHFSRLFKKVTHYSPAEYRILENK